MVRDQLTGFRSFILRGNVVDLAVGVVIGAAFTTVVNAFVKGVITPLIGCSAPATSTSTGCTCATASSRTARCSPR